MDAKSRQAIQALKELVELAIADVTAAEGGHIPWETQQIIRGYIARAFEEGRLMVREPALARDRKPTLRNLTPVPGPLPEDEEEDTPTGKFVVGNKEDLN